MPYNQTLGGTFYGDVETSLFRILLTVNGPGLFADASLPSSDGAFDDVFGAALAIDLAADLDGDGFFDTISQFGSFGGDVDIRVSAVPLPAAGMLMAPALALLGLRRRRRGTTATTR